MEVFEEQKHDEHWFGICVSYFLILKDFMRFMRKRDILYLQFEKLKEQHLIHETALRIPY